jgi:preprotein translocase subunit SecG
MIMLAANESLPVEALSKGGFSDGAMSGATVVAPFVTLLNTVIAILATIFLAYTIFHLVLRMKDVISGAKNYRSMRDDFIGLGIAAVVLAISLTGGWYSLLNWVYTNVIVKVLGAFK